MSARRVMFGLWLSPIIGALVVTAILFLTEKTLLITNLKEIAMFFLAILTFSYSSAAIFGVPIFLILDKLRINKWWLYLLSGYLCAFLTIILVFTVFGGDNLYALFTKYSLPCVGGAVGGVAFWWLVVKSDKSYSK